MTYLERDSDSVGHIHLIEKVYRDSRSNRFIAFAKVFPNIYSSDTETRRRAE